MSIQFRTEKKIFFKDAWPWNDVKKRKYFLKKLPRFFDTQILQGDLNSLFFFRESCHVFALL